jgi:hypothetical protein
MLQVRQSRELASGAMRALGVGGTLGGFLVSAITALTGA